MTDISRSWEDMSGGKDIAVAVRSSATAEDLPDASFAGQQETFLNVRGIDHLIVALHEVFASLFNDRAIAYRVHQGFDHSLVALSVGVQYMVRSDIGAAGVVFTLDTESGFRDAVFITSSYGLGETVVQGAVNPDEFYVYKPALKSGKFAILRKNLGSKAIKMIYSEDPQPGKTVDTVDVDPVDSMRFSLSDADITQLGIEFERMHAALAPDARLLGTAERCAQIAQEPAIYPGKAGFHLRRHAVGAGQVLCP